MSLGKNLKKLRLEHHLTQMELAKATGINRSTIGMYEEEKMFPKVSKLQILANYFHVDMNTLLAEGGPEPAGEPSVVKENLTAEERRHLEYYRNLDADQRTKVDGYIEALLMEQKKKATLSENVAM